MRLLLPTRDKHGLVADELHKSLDGSLKRAGTEENDILPRLSLVLASVGLVLEEGRQTRDVGAGGEHNAIVSLLAAEAVEQTSSPLEVRRLEGRDGETESVRECLAKAGDRVEEGIEVHELGTSSATTVYGLDEGNLDLREAGNAEDLVDGVGSRHSSIVRKGAGPDSNGDNEVTDESRLSSVGVCERVDRVPVDLELVEDGGDGPRDRAPSRLDAVVVDGASGTSRLGHAGPVLWMHGVPDP